MGETRDEGRTRTLRWMAKAGATVVFAVLVVPHDQPMSAYWDALRTAQRTYNQ